MYYFREFLQLADAKGIKVICCVSPSYKANPESHYYDPVRQLCRAMNVPFWDYSADVELSQDKSYFQDRTHMNHVGAVRYTGKVMKCLN